MDETLNELILNTNSGATAKLYASSSLLFLLLGVYISLTADWPVVGVQMRVCSTKSL
jgi:hypothetical protein